MKTLNRTLSLVLVLVMVLGLFGVAGAAYTDDADVTYVEAVDVTSAIGVFNGINNAFQPKGDLTREQAAKIICYLTMGQAAADKLTASEAPFTDVAADRWSAGSIAYCVQQGIVAGMGDGTFAPEANVTGYQFAKMLLVAMGYDATIEQMIGQSWAINVAKLGFLNKLFEGNDAFVGTQKANREEAALYVLNTLLAPTYTYATKGTNITTEGGATINIGASAPAAGATFMAQYYSNLKVNNGDTRNFLGLGTDDFGRASNNWTFKGAEVGKYATEAALIYTADMNSTAKTAELTKALKGYTVLDADGAGGNSGIFASINGKPDVVDITASNLVATVAGYTGNGTVVEIGVDATNAKQINSISVIKSELAQVSSVTASSIVITVKSATVAGQGTYTVKSTDDLYDSLKGYTADDYLMITPKHVSGATYEIAAFYAPTKVTGKITTIQTNPNDMLKGITVGGKLYYEAAAKDSTVATAAPSTTEEATVLLDEYGYAVRVKAATTATTDFIYVLDAYNTLVDGKIVPMAKGILTNGTTVDVEINDDAVTKDNAGNASVGIAKDCNLYKVTSTTNDVYTLADMPTPGTPGSKGALAPLKTIVSLSGKIASSDKALSYAAQGVTFTPPSTYSANYYNNYYASNVKFVYVNTTAKTATVKEGVQEVAVIPATAYAIVEAKSASDATPVVTTVILVDGIAATVASDSLVFFPSTTQVASTTLHNNATNKDETFPVYVAYVNGEQTRFPTKSTIAAAGTYYSYAANDNVMGAQVLAAAPYTATTSTTSTFAGKVTSTFDDTLVSLTNADPTTIANIDISGATIVDVRTDADKDAYPVVLTASGLCDAANYGLTLSVVFNADTGKASLVYVLKRDTGITLTLTYDDANFVVYTDQACNNAVTTGTQIAAGTTLYVKSTSNVANKSELTSTQVVLNEKVAAVDGTSAAIYSFTMPLAYAPPFVCTQA